MRFLTIVSNLWKGAMLLCSFLSSFVYVEISLCYRNHDVVLKCLFGITSA